MFPLSINILIANNSQNRSHLPIAFKFFLVDRIDPPENEYYPFRKNPDSPINNDLDLGNRLVSISRSARVVEPGRNWARRNLRNFRWTVGVGGRAETKDIRLFGRRRRPLSTSATTGSIEFRWITIARGCNGKRTLTSPVVGVLASSIPSSIQLSVVQHSPLVRARTTLVLLGKRSNPLVSPRTKTTSLFFSKPPEP